ncbi:right-handed parallel beta-helix repeat-containing protein [Methanobrevibacter sp.]|uniref:right-handed parallel beta-helix repeat-containing protein n=1 Tax=Methanobrevibacter sp. TaxID=66852 RepID=UPI003890D925
MSINKKIFCLLIVLIFCLGVSSASAADVTSDIIASEDTAVDADVIGEASFDENLGAGETYVITNATFGNYFTAGELNDNVTAGSTLDFQGTFTGVDYKVNITKPVNIISSTGDALFNEIGKKDSTGGCFHISNGGSGTNVTDLSFINSAFYVTNASDVNIENIYMMANMSGIGQGTGFMCVQAGSRYVTVKDSYFENRGTGSSIVVIGYSDYCTIDNNEVVVNGSSGNAIYMTTYVPAQWKGHDPIGNKIINNYIHGEKSGLCMALVVAGDNHLIEGNVIDYNGPSGIALQYLWGTTKEYSNSTYKNNVLTGGCGFTTGANANIEHNSVEGSMTAGSNSTIKDNTMDSLSLSKPNCIVDNNVIGEKGVTLNAAALNTTLTNNVILSKVNVKSKNNTIQNNTISVDDEYAVDLFTTTGNEVSGNNLISANFTGDAAVKAGEGNSVHDNGGIDNIVTKDNFFVFFDENGNYRGLNFTDLIFKGDFDGLVDAITINQTLSIEGLNANLNDMAFILLADGISLYDLELNFDKAPVLSNGSAILINAPNVSILNITTTYVINESADAYVIYAEDADNLTIANNVIDFNATTDGAAVNNAICVLDSAYVLVENNMISAYIPSCAVPWREIPPGSGIWVGFPVSEGVVFDGCSDLTVTDNIITVVYNGVVGAYDTVYAVDIKNSENVEFTDNSVSGLGHSYIYGLYVEADNLVVDSNLFSIVSDNNYANGIEVEASTDAVISNNIFNIAAPKFAYPIYSGMNGGDLEVDYIGNDINAVADVVYGMELCGNIENVYNNTITVEGNKTTALAIKSKESYIFNNTLNALGVNLGNSTSPDTFAAITAGINLQNSKATAEENIINSNSIGILVNSGEVAIINSEINVEDNGLDDSYAIIAEESEIIIDSNEINYVGDTEGATINNVICLSECDTLYVTDNRITALIPSCYVDWKEEPAGSGIWVKYPISEGVVIKESPDLVFTGNDVHVEVNSVVGAYDTIYVIDIKDSENANVSGNEIAGLGFTYIYGLYIESDNGTVDSNNFIISAEDYYANGIEIEASVGAVVSNNNFDITAPGLAYPVYSGMNGGDLEVDYIANIINATADIVYGMELCGSVENVFENTITVNGNKTTALAIQSEEVYVYKNIINALGVNLGNSTAVETFKPMTAGINIQGSNAIIEENEIVSNSIGILVNGDEVTIENNGICVEDNALADSYAIIAQDSIIGINSNNITYIGNTNGSTINNAINLKDCVADLSENKILASMPSCYVDWKEEPAGSGIWVKYPVSEAIVIDGCPDLVLTNNEIIVGANSIVGAYDTLYVMDIKDCANANISENDVSALGHTYIYGLYIEADNATVEDNVFEIESDTYYANAIEVEASKGIVITDNTIYIEAPLVYGIYSGMNGGDLEAEYSNNFIIAEGGFVYGMELMGLNENVLNNTFVLDGSDAIAIYSLSKNVTVKDNSINITAEDDSTALAFLGKAGNATITDNEIQTTGEYTIDVSKISALVKDNYLVADVLTGDASVDYDLETSSVYNNTPKMDKYFLITDGLEKYFGNAKALEFRLIDASGNPIANQTIKISIRGQDYTRKTDANGTARMNINLDAGSYNATATYENQSVVADITILSTIQANDLTKMFRNATQFEATFVDTEGNVLNNTDVTFNINGVFYTRKTNENGTAKLNINLEPKEYVITSINPVNSEQKGNTVTVLSTITDNNNLTKYYRNESQYAVKILDSQGNAVGAGENVTFNINGVFYTRTTNASGIAKLNINLEPGEYIITAYYNDCTVANTIKVLPTLVTEDLSMKYLDGSKFNATVLDGQGNPYPGQNVTFNVNGVLYTRLSDSNGVSKLNINLMPGTYIITSTYNQLNVANKITISS